MRPAPATVLLPHARDSLGGSAVSGALIADAVATSARWAPVVVVHRDSEPGRYHRRLGLPVESLGLRRLTAWPENRLTRMEAMLRLAAAAERYLGRHRPALIHVNDDESAFGWGLAARRRRIPLIWHVRQPIGTRPVDALRLSCASYLIFVSEAVRGRFRWSAHTPPGSVVHNGLDLAEFGPPVDRVQAKARIGLATDRLALGFVGNLVARKRPEWVVRAWLELLRQGACADLVLVGADYSGGSRLAQLQGLVAAQGAQDRFHYLGPRDDVADVMRALDILALPSQVNGEAFPRVVIEAMASGVATVATAVAGIPEAVTDGSDGLLVGPSDFDGFVGALERLVRDGALRARLGASGRATTERRFSSAETGRAVLRIYDEVAQVVA